MGPTWVLSAPDGSHVGPMGLPIRVNVLLSYVWNSNMLCYAYPSQYYWVVYLAEWVAIYFVGDVYILIFSPTFSIARNRITDFLLINVSVYSFSHRLPLTYTLVHFFLRRKAFLWRFEARNANWKIACDRLAFLMTNGLNGPCLINGAMIWEKGLIVRD